ncbi:MAG: malonyl-CoA decarboxylase [Flavobacterium sp.]|jgi:malonyl-CoA decarboxylase
MLQELFTNLSERSLSLFAPGTNAKPDVDTLLEWCDTLLSRKGEASGVAWAQRLLEGFRTLDDESRLVFYRELAKRYQPDPADVIQKTTAYAEDQNPETLKQLILTVEPQRQELFRRLNLAPNGTTTLVALRQGLFQYLKKVPELTSVDNDLRHLFSSWFNRGFLVLRRIDWNTSAVLLEKIIQYEAVHEINGWDDLRRRVNPSDRRCFAFFHPALGEDPLIFVEVALTRDTPASIAEVLDENRQPNSEEKPTTAVFYSISNCQDGLRGVSFGSFLIKQVARELSQELPSLNRFVTLSPVPGFVNWLRFSSEETSDECRKAALEIIDQPNWIEEEEKNAAAQKLLMPLAAHYLVNAQYKNLPLDPVARFHIGNGSSLDRINWAADTSIQAMQQSAGIMVNYLYDLDKIEVNHEACAEKGIVTASRNVTSLLKDFRH